MRRPSARMTPNAATKQTVAFGRDAAAGRQGTPSAPYPAVRCAIEPASTKDVPEHWREQGVTYLTLKFYDDPHARIRDQFVDDLGRLLVVIGARGPTALRRTWVLDCEHVPPPGS